MNAYSKIYLEDAMSNLAVMLDYGTLVDGDPQRFFDRFIVSGISNQFERGNPKYIAGHSGVELAELVLKETGAEKTTETGRADTKATCRTDWCQTENDTGIRTE